MCCVAGSPNRRAWLFQDFFGEGCRGLLQLDLDPDGDEVSAQSWRFEPWERPSEPVFVPRSDDAPEGDGWVLTLVHDARARTSHAAIFDTQRFAEGPQARAHFEHHVPMTFHGVWIPQRARG